MGRNGPTPPNRTGKPNIKRSLEELRNTIHLGDCLELMPHMNKNSVDLILCDLPYGTTNCRWDTVIPFEPLWAEYKRILKPGGAIVLTANQPFTSALVMSNPDWFKHEWIWGKSKCGSPLAAKYRPMAKHENILVFGKGKITYNPKMVDGVPYKRDFTPAKLNNHGFGIKGAKTDNPGVRYPDTILFFQQKWRRQDQVHPTQKPVSLFKYLVETYSNPGDLVLDNCAGSGTTGLACIEAGRDFILMEKDAEYYATAMERVGAALEAQRSGGEPNE